VAAEVGTEAQVSDPRTAIWRGAAVKVLASDAKTAVIITPLAIHLRVRAAELQPIGNRKKNLRDSRKIC